MQSPTRSVLTPILAGLLLVGLPAAASGAPDTGEPDGGPADRGPDVAAAEANRLEHLADQGLSHASGNRPELGTHQVGEPATAVDELRIGIRYSYTASGARSEFHSVDHPAVEIAATAGDVEVVDQATGATVLTAAAEQVVRVEHDGTAYGVTDASGTTTSVTGPVRFRALGDDNFLSVPSITRLNVITWASYLTPEYRGELEVTRSSQTADGMVNLVNHVALEDYVPGVVINESPAFFHPESLKSQATTARGYAVANVGRFIGQGFPFDLDDSTRSQVYRGRTAEHPNGNAAAAATRGLVASWEGDIISAFYSSSMAGHPENIEWSLGSIGNPDVARPYLVGRYDGPAGTEPDLSTEAGRRAFWEGEQAQVYDSRDSSGNSRNRWNYTLTAEEATAAVNARSFAADVVSGSTSDIGVLDRCEPTQHSPTGRIMVVRCTGSTAVWDFAGWDNVRRLFPSPIGVLNNPAFLDHVHDADGNLESITAIGGGWGHNVGMSQYGAHGRGLAGQSFGEILTFYYKGTTIGSHPVDLQVDRGRPTTWQQEFNTIDGTGTLVVRDIEDLKSLTVVINGTEAVDLGAGELTDPVVEVNVSEHLSADSTNVVEYTAHGVGGSATTLVRVHE